MQCSAVQAGVEGAQVVGDGQQLVRTGVPTVDAVELQLGAPVGGKQRGYAQERLIAGEPSVVACR